MCEVIIYRLNPFRNFNMALLDINKKSLLTILLFLLFSSVATLTMVEAADDADIYSVTWPSGTYSHGQTMSTRVYVRNTGTTTRRFWVGNSYRKPDDATWYNVPPKQTNTLYPGSSTSITLYWTVPSGAPLGYYDDYVAVWNGYSNGDMVEPQYDVVSSHNNIVIVSTGSLRVYVRKPSELGGSLVSGANVKLLTTGEVETTGAGGYVDFTGLSYGSHGVEVRYPSPAALGLTEYWGGETYTISSSSTTKTFYRHSQWIQSITVDGTPEGS